MCKSNDRAVAVEISDTALLALVLFSVVMLVISARFIWSFTIRTEGKPQTQSLIFIPKLTYLPIEGHLPFNLFHAVKVVGFCKTLTYRMNYSVHRIFQGILHSAIATLETMRGKYLSELEKLHLTDSRYGRQV